MITVKEVETKKERKQFFRFPIELYKGNEYVVPPLISDEEDEFNPEKNGAFEYCQCKMFLAYNEKGKVVGRIAGILSKAYNEKASVRQLRFTRYDVIDDFAVTEALFNKLKEWAKELEMNEIIGPIGFSDFDKQGMLIEGYDKLGMFVTIYNYPYYAEHMKKLGMEKEVDWVEYLIKVPEKVDERLDRLANRIKERYGFNLVELKGFKNAQPIIHEVLENIFNEAFARLYGVVKVNRKQIEREAKMLEQVWDDDFVFLVENKEGDYVGYGFMAGSVSNAMRKFNGKINLSGIFAMIRDLKNPEVVDLYNIGVKDDYRNTGVNVLILVEGIKRLIKRKVKYIETGPELETNIQIQSMWKHFEKEQHKRRRCWSLKLN